MPFKFEDVIVGSKGHAELMKRLGDLTEKKVPVKYEEYVTEPGQRETLSIRGECGHKSNVVCLQGRVVKCRGSAKT